MVTSLNYNFEVKNLILASTSKYRKELLKRLGHEFQCVPPNVDEDQFKDIIKDPIELAERLGFEKAKAVSQKYKDKIIIGSDQLAECGGIFLSKPKNFENALSQLRILNNKEHRLITSFTVFSGDNFVTKTNITTLKMRDLNDSQLENYLRLDTPYDCAGSYKLELHGISLFESIETTDHTAIIGLPLIELGSVLNKMNLMTPPSVDEHLRQKDQQ
jgi:septum formation protein